jgi:hypothetical protein
MDDTTTGVPVSSAATEEAMEALKKQASFADEYYKQLVSQVKETLKEPKMAEVMTPGMIMGMGGNGGDGLFGGGGGLIGGLILGSLLRNGNGGFLGNDGAGAGALAATLRNPPEQDMANMSLMQSIGQVDKAVAVGTAAMEASQALQSSSIVSQLNNVAGSLAGRIDNVKDVINQNSIALMQGQNAIQQNVMENRYELAKDIATDGDRTRALITAQYEATLNRQLSDSNARVIALETKLDTGAVARGVEVTTTNNINQMQQQQQNAAQYGQLANLIWGLGQSIKDNNSAINVGSGTQTSTNTPTNTNIR